MGLLVEGDGSVMGRAVECGSSYKMAGFAQLLLIGYVYEIAFASVHVSEVV